LFVVLLVLLSIILTAGVVTFVNKVAPLQRDLAAERAKSSAQAAIASARSTALSALENQLNAATVAANAAATTHQTQVQGFRTQIEDRDAQLAQVNNQVAVLTSGIASNSSALLASEAAKGKLQEQVVALRKDADDRLRTNADLGTRVSQLTAENAVLERERRNLSEQLTESQGKVGQLSKLAQDNNIPLTQLDRAGTGAGAPAINGVIRSRRTIFGKEYATISLGSQDQVRQGMEFKILDKDSGAFLGVMTVTEVDANEAIGQIIAEPATLAQIRAGNVVRTQI
jgi:hypothetical protein